MAKMSGESKEVAGCLQRHGPSIWTLVPACSPVLGFSEVGRVGIGDAHTRVVEVMGDKPVPGSPLRCGNIVVPGYEVWSWGTPSQPTPAWWS